LYMEEKSMTGTVKVPSMSKTTPLKRVLVLVDMVVRWERGKGWGFGCKKGMHLKRREGIVRYFGGRYFGGKGEGTGDESVVRNGHVLPLKLTSEKQIMKACTKVETLYSSFHSLYPSNIHHQFHLFIFFMWFLYFCLNLCMPSTW